MGVGSDKVITDTILFVRNQNDDSLKVKTTRTEMLKIMKDPLKHIKSNIY